MLITAKLVKDIVKIDERLYTSTRLYKTKDSIKMKFYELGHKIDMYDIQQKLVNAKELKVYDIEISYDRNDLIIVFKTKCIAYGLKAISNYDEQIKTAAYYIAEKRGFEPGNELEDWLKAKQQVFLDSNSRGS